MPLACWSPPPIPEPPRRPKTYYPGAPVPLQENLVIQNVTVLHDRPTDFLSVNTPVDTVAIQNSRFRDNTLRFHGKVALDALGKTRLNLLGCVFAKRGPHELLCIESPGKQVELTTLPE